jgi:hypothetical protein
MEALRTFAAAALLLQTADKLQSDQAVLGDLVDAIALLSAPNPRNEFQGDQLAALLERTQLLGNRVGALKERAATIRQELAVWRESGPDRRRNARRVAAQTLLDTADEFLKLTDEIGMVVSTCNRSACGFDGEAVSAHLSLAVGTVRKYDAIVVSVMENEWADVASRFSELFLHSDGQQQSERTIGRLAPVVSELAAAQSAVEVQSILNNAAAPAGSYREKFQARTRSITAFAGVSVGREKNDLNHEWGNTRGLFLPVGLHISWPCERSCYGIGKGARGAFFSIIDLGPYAEYRDTGTGVEHENAPGLRQLFVPGAYLTWNISTAKSRGSLLDELFYRSPFVFGLGVARAPALIDSATGQRVDATRIQAFFAIDVTMFPF